MLSSNTLRRSRPRRFASYMAISACRSSSSALPACQLQATPMLTETNRSCAPRRNSVGAAPEAGRRERAPRVPRPSLDEQREFVAADPGERLLGPERVSDALRERDSARSPCDTSSLSLTSEAHSSVAARSPRGRPVEGRSRGLRLPQARAWEPVARRALGGPAEGPRVQVAHGTVTVPPGRGAVYSKDMVLALTRSPAGPGRGRRCARPAHADGEVEVDLAGRARAPSRRAPRCRSP